ncbi:MAG TPA: phage holin family protein [Burkholderiales bacterium]|nr:phage holin family protein [Burkholderiales bacterium]
MARGRARLRARPSGGRARHRRRRRLPVQHDHAEQGLSSAPAARPPGFAELLGRLLGEAKALASDYALLAVLDARRAALRLAWLLGTVLVAAVLVVTAWLALVAGGIVLLLGQGTPWPLALGIAAGLNLVGAGALAWWMRNLVSEMPFNALVRSLRGEAPSQP